MEGYGKETYGEQIADEYDDLWRVRIRDGETEDAVTLLAGLAGEQRRAVELAVGTGRIALPLQAQGVHVTGVDLSPAMVAKLRAKPGGDSVDVVMGDFADVPVTGTWPLIFIVFNTLFALPDQDAQLRCFANVAEHLEPGGAFVIEAFVPDLGRYDLGQRTQTDRIRVDRVDLTASRVDIIAQVIEAHHVVLRDGEPVRLHPVVVRYAFPAELDLMARLAGLELRDRWSGWRRQPFGRDSTQHVSVYVKP
jgi:SAM-dependent methyltransferase